MERNQFMRCERALGKRRPPLLLPPQEEEEEEEEEAGGLTLEDQNANT